MTIEQESQANETASNTTVKETAAESRYQRTMRKEYLEVDELDSSK